jgi:TM2 domain-containing membrane protein YozV
MFGRQKLGNVRPLRREVELVPIQRRELGQRTASPALAAFLSLWIPGAGQLYAGRAVAAVLWFLVVGAGYALILPGLLLHLFCIASAAISAGQTEPLLLARDSRVRGYLAAA